MCLFIIQGLLAKSNDKHLVWHIQGVGARRTGLRSLSVLGFWGQIMGKAKQILTVASRLRASLRILLLRLCLGAALLIGGAATASAACDTSVTFSSRAINATAILDVSTCDFNVRSGLYDVMGPAPLNYPMVANRACQFGPPNTCTLVSANFTLTDGTTVYVIPTGVVDLAPNFAGNSGFPIEVFDSYQITLTSVPVTNQGSLGTPPIFNGVHL
jgi:hypothetical protein